MYVEQEATLYFFMILGQLPIHHVTIPGEEIRSQLLRQR